MRPQRDDSRPTRLHTPVRFCRSCADQKASPTRRTHTQQPQTQPKWATEPQLGSPSCTRSRQIRQPKLTPHLHLGLPKPPPPSDTPAPTPTPPATPSHKPHHRPLPHPRPPPSNHLTSPTPPQQTTPHPHRPPRPVAPRLLLPGIPPPYKA